MIRPQTHDSKLSLIAVGAVERDKQLLVFFLFFFIHASTCQTMLLTQQHEIRFLQVLRLFCCCTATATQPAKGGE